MASLSGRADATLVKAATDAAMANVPMDISRVHERISKSNAAMTKSVGKSWVSAIESVAKIGVGLMNKAKTAADTTVKEHENFEANQKENKLSSNDPLVSGIDPTNKTGMVNVVIDGVVTSVPAEDRFNYSAIKGGGTTDVTGFQAITEFNHTNADGNPLNVTVANTSEFAEKVRDDIYELKGKKEQDLKDIESNPSYSKEEKSLRKKQIKENYKKDKKRLKDVKGSMDNSNMKFAQFYESLNSQLLSKTINMDASGIYGANKLLFAEALQNKGKPLKDGSKAVQGYDESGNLVFMYVDKNNKPIQNNGKDITLAGDNVGDLLVKESPIRPVIDGIINIENINGSEKAYSYELNNYKSNIGRMVDQNVKDKETFLDLAFTQSENTNGSLADTLHSVKYDDDGVPVLDGEDPTDLAGVFITALTDMPKVNNKHPYDTDGDGDFDKDDYNNEGNYMALVKKALSGDDLNFSKSLLKKHLEIETARHLDNAFTFKEANKDTKLANVLMNNTMMSGKDYDAAYGPNSKFMLFLNDETELAVTEAVEFTSPAGYEYQRRGDGIYQLTNVDDKGKKIYDKKITTDGIKRKEKIPGTNKSIIPDFTVDSADPADPADPAVEVEVPNSADFAAFASPKKILASWKKRYEGKGFKYDVSVGGTVVTITADNGKTHVAKLATLRGNRNDQAKALNEFIEKNKKTTDTLKGLSPKEIKESVAKGEESKFNVGPDGELLSEGYTMNDLGEVVWVGAGPEPTKK